MAHVTINLAAMEGLADQKAEAGIRKAALQGEARLKIILNQQGSGVSYTRGGRTKQRSAPGEPPSPDQGELLRKTQADTQVRREGQDLVGRIVQNVDYALALAAGTEKMAPRPSAQLLATDHADELRQAFIQGARE